MVMPTDADTRLDSLMPLALVAESTDACGCDGVAPAAGAASTM